MPRAPRIDVGGYAYHIINRANARARIFELEENYEQFEELLDKGVEQFNMRLLAYCVMPNHWHLVLYPYEDGNLSEFMGWLTNAHTRRWHSVKNSVGYGSLYQGRYKSFLCQQDEHLFTLLRYVEGNAKRANLVERAEEWRWSSVWRRVQGSEEQKKMLSSWPIPEPNDYLLLLNELQSKESKGEIERIRRSVGRSCPYGQDVWMEKVARQFGIESTLRPRGRPKKGA